MNDPLNDDHTSHDPTDQDPTNLEEMRMWALVERAPDDVWTAMTTTEGLRGWLAHEVQIEAREGGALVVASGTPMTSGEHVIRTIDARQHRLEIEWRIEGHPTAVTWSLEPVEGGTRVTFAHRYPQAPAFALDPAFDGPLDVFRELWAYQAGLLKTHLELGEAKCRLDPARTPASAVRHVMTVDAAPAEVFAAIDDPEQVVRWNPYAPAPRNERRVGGRYSYGWKSEEKQTDGPDRIVEYEAGKRITFTWHGDPPTLVSWTVEPLPDAPDRTRLTLVHSGFGVDRNMLVGWNLGWASFLHQLVLWLQNGAAPTWVGE